MKEKMILWYIEYEKYKDDKSYINKLVEYFQLLITTTAQNIFGFKKYNKQSVNWVDQKVYDTLQTKKIHVVHLTRSWLLEYITIYIDCMTSCQLYVIL